MSFPTAAVPLSDASDWKELIQRARLLVGEFPLLGPWTAGSVGSALITDSGRIHTGISFDLPCGMGACAEHSAIAEMLKSREKRVRAIVAVDDSAFLPPCGRCRELLAQLDPLNLNTVVVLGEAHTVALSDLLPHRWLMGSARPQLTQPG